MAFTEIAGLVVRELALFAAAGFLIGGLDELAIDGVWLVHRLRRRAWRHARVDAATLAAAERPGRIAVFVPAWDEADVIGRMLATSARRFGPGDWRIYVGCYPNDPATLAALSAVAVGEPRIRAIVGPRPGPTTKADNLNTLWRALLADEAAEGMRVKAVVLHDAEDLVHPAEPRLFDRLIERFDLVQLPVLPLIDPKSRWVAGHYADAFAEAHGKGLVAREALGASIPAAGVGCAFSRATLALIAEGNGGMPFDAASLTEDYELGLRIHALGGRAAFVRLPGAGMGSVVAVREYFPHRFEDAVRQKARWMAGIALDGWDRLGWAPSGRRRWAENWMRLRDRRAPIAALVVAAGYLTATGLLVLWLTGADLPAFGPVWTTILSINGWLLVWRLGMRMGFVAHAYGWREGVRAVPRLMIGNAIDIVASVRAIGRYLAARRAGVVTWDKTRHRFPALEE